MAWVAALAMTVGAAKADTIQTLYISGTLTESGAWVGGGSISMPAGGEIDLDYTTGFVDTASVSGLGFYSDNIFGFGPPVTFSQSFILGLSQNVCCVPQRQMDWFGFTLADLVGGFFTTGTMSGAGGLAVPLFFDPRLCPPDNSRPVCDQSSRYSYTGTITDTNPTPLPAALPLFASGLGALGLLGWRRKRKNAAA